MKKIRNKPELKKGTSLVVSDLHLYFGNFKEKTDAEYIIVAGDSCEGKLAANMYVKMLNNGHKILFVCGNHEYYGTEFSKVNDYWEKFDNDHENFHFLNNRVVELDGLRFVGTTLWGNIPEAYHGYVKKRLNDFKYIFYENKRNPITPEDYCNMFQESLLFLEENLQEDDVLITHHAPSFLSLESREDNPLNYCYVNNIESLIKERKPRMAFHGHLHKSSDYYIGDTRVISNPRGYVNQSEGFNKDFNDRLIVELQKDVSLDHTFKIVKK